MNPDRSSSANPSSLRLLSEQEMEVGLDPLDRAMMNYRAHAMRLDQKTNHTKNLVQILECFVKDIASQRSAEGKIAYFRLEGTNDIVRHNLDGTKDIVELVDGQPIFIRSL